MSWSDWLFIDMKRNNTKERRYAYLWAILSDVACKRDVNVNAKIEDDFGIGAYAGSYYDWY